MASGDIWGHAVGGMGAISDALAAEARRLGVEIECDAPVARVRPRLGCARPTAGELAARAIVANVNPKLLFLQADGGGRAARGIPRAHAALQVRLGHVSA